MYGVVQSINTDASALLSGLTESIHKNISTAEDLANKASTSITSGTEQAFEFVSDMAKKFGNSSAEIGEITKRSASTIATTIFDQNGDGSLDQEDLKILTEKSIDLSKLAAESVIDAAKSIASSDLVKDSAAAAAVGAVIAVPVPLVGPATGAVVGAIVGAYSHLTKKK